MINELRHVHIHIFVVVCRWVEREAQNGVRVWAGFSTVRMA